jgi:hypothetical protein
VVRIRFMATCTDILEISASTRRTRSLKLCYR